MTDALAEYRGGTALYRETYLAPGRRCDGGCGRVLDPEHAHVAFDPSGVIRCGICNDCLVFVLDVERALGEPFASRPWDVNARELAAHPERRAAEAAFRLGASAAELRAVLERPA